MGTFSRRYQSLGIRGRILFSGISVIAAVLLATVSVMVVRSNTWFSKAAHNRLSTATELALLDLDTKAETKRKIIELVASDDDVVFNASVLHGAYADLDGSDLDESSQELCRDLGKKIKNASHVGDFDLIGIFGHKNQLLAFFDRRQQMTGFSTGSRYVTDGKSLYLSFSELPENIQLTLKIVENGQSSGYSRYGMGLAQTIVIPVRDVFDDRPEKIATIVGTTFVTDDYANQLSKASNTHVNFYHGSVLLAGEFRYIERLSDKTLDSLKNQWDKQDLDNRLSRLLWQETTINNESFTQALYPLYEINGEVGSLLVMHSNRSDQRNKRNTLWLMVLTALLVGGLGSILMVVSANQIVRPLKASLELSRLMAIGDLSSNENFDGIGGDEAEILRRTMLSSVKQLRDTLKGVTSATTDVDHMATALFGAVTEEMGIATEQASSVTEITATIEELSATSKQIAENSNQVLEIASTNLAETESGSEIVQNLMAKMDEINANNEESINKIVDLGKNSQEITKVIDLISGIADQTKLIAFNASIEASGAGDAGRRFGVVAMEIRRLANNVMESTSEIKERVHEIQTAVSQLVMASEKGSNGIRGGRDLAVATVNTLTGLVEDARSTSDAARQISMSTQQQKIANDQVVVSLREIAQGANNTADSINRTKQIANDLKELSRKLKDQVDRFKLE